MKTLIKILVLLLFPIIGLTQQTDINYNFSNHSYTENSKIKKLKQGDFYRLKIDSINLNVYRVEVETKDSTTYKPIDFSSFISHGASLSSLLKTVSGSLSSLALPDRYKSIEAKEIAGDTIKNLFKKTYDTILKENENLMNLGKRIDKEKSIVELRIKKAGLIDISQLEKIDFEFIQKELASFEGIHADVKKQKAKVDEIAEVTNALIAEYDTIEKYKKLVTELTKAKNDLVKAINKLDANSNETYRNKLATKLYDYVNNSETTYTSMPIQLTKDMANISFKIVPIDSGSRLPSYHSTLNVPGTRQWYWAVGAGGYYSNLYDEHYSLSGVQLTDSTAAYEVISEDVNPADTSESVYSKEFGASVGLKVGYRLRSCPGIGFHGSLGSGFSFTKNVRPRLMLGIGASFGYKHRLTLDAGWIAGYTERLSRAYSGGITIAEPVERVTVSKVQHGYFIGVGYVFVM